MASSKTKQVNGVPSVLQKGEDPSELKLKIVLPPLGRYNFINKGGGGGAEEHEQSGSLSTSPFKKKEELASPDTSSPMDCESQDSETSTQSKSKSSMNGTYWEPCLIGQQKLSLPSSISNLADLSGIFNMEVWNNSLTKEERDSLTQYLPPLDEKATEANLVKLFGGNNFHFGNPITTIHNDLQAGECHIQVARKKEKYRFMQRKEHLHNVRLYHNKMIKKIFEFRKSLGLDDTKLINEYMSKQNAVNTTSSSIDSHSEHIKTENEARPNRLITDTESSSESEIANAFKSKKRKSHPPSEKRKSQPRAHKVHKQSDEEVVHRVRSEKAVKVDVDIVKSEPTEISSPLIPSRTDSPSGEGSPAGWTPSSQPAFFLFSTLRDYFEEEEHNFSGHVGDLVKRVQKFTSLVDHFPPGYDVEEFVRMGLVFLAHPPSLTSAAQNTQPGSGTGISYEDPITMFDKPTQTWFWVDRTEKDKPGSPSGDEHLHSLEQLFFFATARNFLNPDNTVDLTITTNRQQKCILTIDPTNADVAMDFHRQEQERYKVPEKSFVYSFNGSKTIVAPMKRGVGNPTNKPREHFLLKAERPPHINLLCLVRDAASRLPGGVGTRPDVSMLLRDSQYVVETITDAQINSVVSGALDRLHSERDPCVRFDAEQKLWIYLHRHRTEKDYITTKQKPKRTGGRARREPKEPRENREPKHREPREMNEIKE